MARLSFQIVRNGQRSSAAREEVTVLTSWHRQQCIVGNKLSEADVRLNPFTVAPLAFSAVTHPHNGFSAAAWRSGRMKDHFGGAECQSGVSRSSITYEPPPRGASVFCLFSQAEEEQTGTAGISQTESRSPSIYLCLSLSLPPGLPPPFPSFQPSRMSPHTQ